jgi:hypothetical protein
MNEPDSFDLREQTHEAPHAAAPRSRAVGSPLSTGVSRHAPYPSAETKVKRLTPPPPGRVLGNAPAAAEESSNLQRAVNVLRSALPFVQRLLPLLDGNIASTLGNLLQPHTQAHQPSAKLDLTPVEDGLAELRSQQHGLRLQVTEQNTTLKRVEDQLEMVREATDRNTLEQQELLEDLKAFGTKVKFVAIVALVLAAVGFFMTLALFLHIQKVLP